MPEFTKDQMYDELRTIFLFEADHILLGAGKNRAVEFIGFPLSDDEEYCFQAASKVDLSRFARIPGSFDRGYDYAFRPSTLNSLGEHEIQDLSVFMQGVPRAGGAVSGGETHNFMTPNGYCQMVADTAYARWKLEWDSIGAGDHNFTPRELALLADMTEGAVRNAVADKSESGLKAIPGTKNPIRIERDEAWRWLNLRRGFVPSPIRPSEDRFLADYIRDIQSNVRFGSLISTRLRGTFDSPKDASAALNWSPEEVERWCDGSFRFNIDCATQLAQALDIDAPLFVGKAIELSLRRDSLRAEHSAK